MSAQFYRCQRVRETATGKVWYVTAVYPRSVTVQHNRVRTWETPNLCDGERVFKREELEPVDAARALTNIEAILAELRRLGVEFRLEGNRFRYASHAALSEGHQAGIMVCRESILEQLRIEAGICITCGEGRAEHPSYIGFAGNRDSKQANERQDMPERLRKPHLWCRECWEYGGWRRAFPGWKEA